MSQSIAQQSRFKDAPWFPKHHESVIIGGAGGIGSWLSYFMTKVGFGVHLYDFDTVEVHNLGGQLFRQTDIGKSKVKAIEDIVQDFCGNHINTYNEAITEESSTHYFVFSAFDNMKARKIMFNNWKESWKYIPEGIVPIFIDGRLEIEQIQIFCITPDNADKYEAEHIFPDSNVEEISCTMKQTSHTAAMIASLMTGFFTNHITNIYEKEIIREVPCYFEYVVPMNYSNSELW